MHHVLYISFLEFNLVFSSQGSSRQGVSNMPSVLSLVRQGICRCFKQFLFGSSMTTFFATDATGQEENVNLLRTGAICLLRCHLLWKNLRLRRTAFSFHLLSLSFAIFPCSSSYVEMLLVANVSFFVSCSFSMQMQKMLCFAGHVYCIEDSTDSTDVSASSLSRTCPHD